MRGDVVMGISLAVMSSSGEEEEEEPPWARTGCPPQPVVWQI